MKPIRVAVVGALGAVGREMISVLEESSLEIEDLKLLDIQRNSGKKLMFRGKEKKVQTAELGAFTDIDIALFSAGATASKVIAPIAVDEGAVVIDNSSQWRMEEGIPLIVPEVNPEALKEHRGLIANPNCSTIQMLVTLKPLHDRYRIKRVVVSTYQAVSGSGVPAIDELKKQAASFLQGEVSSPEVYPHQIAFNAIPHIDVFVEDNYTKEELKMVNETHKILDPNILVSPTAVRIPVFRGHSESLNIEFFETPDVEEVKRILAVSPGISLVDDPDSARYPLALDAEGKNKVLVGRVRKDITCGNGINLWVVADNLRKGAALNAVQIAETMVEMGLIRKQPVKELI